MATTNLNGYTITKKNGETIQFATDLTVEQAAAVLIADTDKNTQPLQGFAFDLIQAWERHVLEGARFSEAQKLWLLKLATDRKNGGSRQAGKLMGLIEALHRMQEGRKSRVTLRLRGVTVKFCSYGGNAGGAYLFKGDSYIGKITNRGELFGARTTLVFDADEVEATLLAAADDPQAAAVEYGRASGSCSCCGRPLSDPVSLYGGIGPICLEKLAGGDARRQMEAAYKLHLVANF